MWLFISFIILLSLSKKMSNDTFYFTCSLNTAFINVSLLWKKSTTILTVSKLKICQKGQILALLEIITKMALTHRQASWILVKWRYINTYFFSCVNFTYSLFNMRSKSCPYFSKGSMTIAMKLKHSFSIYAAYVTVVEYKGDLDVAIEKVIKLKEKGPNLCLFIFLMLNFVKIRLKIF